jgi:type IV secretory pathway TrbD component
MREFLSIVDGILLVLLFITGFSVALAVVLWLVGIFGVTIWSVAKTLLVFVMNIALIFLIEELMKKLSVHEE